MSTESIAAHKEAVIEKPTLRLGLLDRLLTLWIFLFLAMAVGIGIGSLMPGVTDFIAT